MTNADNEPIKSCPHCRTKVRLSQKTATNGDSRTFLRQSHFSATVWTGLNGGLAGAK